MTEQRSPDELTAENELICEKLLGWTRSKVRGYWFRDHGEHQSGLSASTPTFNSWYHAGLILDELQKRSYDARGAADVLLELGDKLIGALLTPASIRAAALEYIRRLP